MVEHRTPIAASDLYLLFGLLLVRRIARAVPYLGYVVIRGRKPA